MDENNNVENNLNTPQDAGTQDTSPVTDSAPATESVSQNSSNSSDTYVQQAKGLSVASLVLGICSIVLCCAWYLALPSGILAIIFSVIYKNKNGHMNGLAKAGLICGIIGTVIGAIMVIAVLTTGSALTEYLENYRNLSM